MQDYFKDLEIFTPTQNDKFIEITVPVIMDMNYGILKLEILILDDGYIICDDGQNFLEFSYPAKHYYDLFMEQDTNHHFKMQLDGDRIYKKYPYDFNIRVAVNEFVRFFVYLDDFVLKNNL